MNTREALDLVNAIRTIGAATGEEFVEVASRIVFMDDNRKQIIMEAVRLQNEFHDAGIVERGAMLGVVIHESEEGFSAETDL